MPASDERSRHGNVLDDVLREEIKDLTPEQVKRVLEYIETLGTDFPACQLATRVLLFPHRRDIKAPDEP